MQTRLKERYVGWARRLYAEGLCRSHVAEALGVTFATVNGWYHQDEAAGRSWDEARRERERCDPLTVLHKLRRRFADLVEQGESEERLLKLARVIELCSQTQTDTAQVLSALEGLVEFCVRTLSPREIRPIRDAIEGFMLELKRKSI